MFSGSQTLSSSVARCVGREVQQIMEKPQGRRPHQSMMVLVCFWEGLWGVIRRCTPPTKSTSKIRLNYFTSSYPHHDIYTFCYWQIFWHSIWHIFWHFIWHIFWHSIWHIFWHSTWHIFCNMFWHIFWHSIWHIFWHSTWHIFWHMFLHIFWHPIWHIFWYIFWHSIWHSIWQIFWHMFWQTFWHFIWHTFWHSIWHSIWRTWHSIWHIFWHSIWQTFWHFIWHIFWHSFSHSIWHIFWHSIWPLARRVPGWGPAVLTELGRSQVEVQRCSLSSEGPRLRSSGAQCAQTLAVEVQQRPLRAEVGEELGEELARRKWTWEWMQRWWRRSWRRGRRRRWRRSRRRRRTTVIKSNNPHLAGGEIRFDLFLSFLGACYYTINYKPWWMRLFYIGFLTCMFVGVFFKPPQNKTKWICEARSSVTGSVSSASSVAPAPEKCRAAPAPELERTADWETRHMSSYLSRKIVIYTLW